MREELILGQGYDESLGVGLKRTISVDQYIRRDDPLRVLTDAHEVWNGEIRMISIACIR